MRSLCLGATRANTEVCAVVVLLQLGVARQTATAQHRLQLVAQRACGHIGARLFCTPVWRVTHAGDVDAPRGRHHPLHRHLAARQRAGLVRRNDGGRTERFHRGQLLHDGVVARHAAHAHGQHHRENGGQALGHRSHSQRHAQQQNRHHIADAVNVGNKQNRAHHNRRCLQCRDAQHLAQVRNLLLQRRRRVWRGVEQGGNAAHLGLHAGGGDDGAPGALRHRRAFEHHVQPVAQSRRRQERRRVFQHSFALARERRLEQLQRGGLHQARIGAHRVALGEHQQVALDQPGAGHPGHRAVAQHAGGGGGHLCQRRHRLRCLVFLQPPQHRIEHHHSGDHNGVQRPAGRATLATALEPPGGQGHRRCCAQQIDQRVLQMRQRTAPSGHGRDRAEFVGAVFEQPGGGLTGAEPTRQVGAERQRQIGDVAQRRIVGWRCMPHLNRF